MVKPLPDSGTLPAALRLEMRCITLAALLVLFIIADPSKYYFLNDDFEHIPLAAGGHFVFGTFIRPVTDVLLWIDHAFWDKNPVGYHLTSLLIHLANAWLVYRLALSWFARYAPEQGQVRLKAWAAGLLFMLYGFHAEPLLWVICRSGSIGTLFFLLSCLCYMERKRGWIFFGCSLLFFGLGLLTYESTWIYPLTALFISVTDIRKKDSSRNREAPYLIATFFFFGAYLLYLVWRMGNVGNDYSMHNIIRFNPGRLIYNYNTLLGRTMLPYSGRSWIFVSAYGILLAAGSYWAGRRILQGKAAPFLLLLLACLLVSPLPAISLGISTHNSESERYIYLPSVFFVLLVTQACGSLLPRMRGWLAVTMVLLIGHGCLLWHSAQAYRTAGGIIRQSLSALPASGEISTLHVIGLPLQYQGAIMFRTGFNDALRWIGSGCRYERLDTLGSYTYLRAPAAFSIQQYGPQKGMEVLGASFHTRPEGSWDILYRNLHFSFQPGRDMILFWTDSSLIKIK